MSYVDISTISDIISLQSMLTKIEKERRKTGKPLLYQLSKVTESHQL